MQKNNQYSSAEMDRIDYISSCTTRLAIPIGPRFQAVIPIQRKHHTDNNADTLKWLGTRTWPPKHRIKSKKQPIGQGRVDFCSCQHPGSEKCMKKHVIRNNIELQIKLGPAFKSWKFDEMGMLASNSWTEEERRVFEFVVRSNPASQGGSFIKPAMKCFPLKDRGAIIRYYFGVYIPKCIDFQTRGGYRIVDSEDDDDIFYERSLKRRIQADDSVSHVVKARYLAGRR